MPDPFNPVAVAVPSFAPHEVSVLVALAANELDAPTVVSQTVTQPVTLSVTVTLYIPATRLLILCVFALLLHA